VKLIILYLAAVVVNIIVALWAKAHCEEKSDYIDRLIGGGAME